jgi:hypothetical protein
MGRIEFAGAAQGRYLSGEGDSPSVVLSFRIDILRNAASAVAKNGV